MAYLTEEGNAAFQQKVDQILACLGWEWTRSEEQHNSCRVYITGPENTELSIGVDGYGDFFPETSRLEISLCTNGLYNFMPRDVETPKCTASAYRAASDIARDIRRKVIPGAISYVQEGRKRKQAHEDKKARKWAKLEELAEAMGGKVIKSYHNGGGDPDDASAGFGEYGKLQVRAKLRYDESSVNFTISEMKPALALELCAWLKDRR